MPKGIDETNNRYGKLLVIGLSEKTTPKERIWDCLCDCGNYRTLRGSELRSGKITCCVECNKKNVQRYKEEEIGNKYGKLTIISKSDKKINGHICWNCKCDCGSTVIAIGTRLRIGEAKQCSTCGGLSNAGNTKVGDIYGKLTVIEQLKERTKDRHILWKCKCECGNICNCSGIVLRNGTKTHCGCQKIISKGEQKIEKILTDSNIIFEKEKTFENCKFNDTNLYARFDFYLPKYNILIEYDGEQHYKNYFGWSNEEHYLRTKKRDEFKNQWCLSNNIQLIRIPYWHYNSLELKDLLYDSEYTINA